MMTSTILIRAAVSLGSSVALFLSDLPTMVHDRLLTPIKVYVNGNLNRRLGGLGCVSRNGLFTVASSLSRRDDAVDNDDAGRNKEDTLEIILTEKTSKVPVKAAVGYNLHSLETVNINALSAKKIRTGIIVNIPNGYYGRISSLSGNRPWLANTIVTDNAIITHVDQQTNEQTAELAVCVFNASINPLEIKEGSPIAQLICEKIITIPTDDDCNGDVKIGSVDVVDTVSSSSLSLLSDDDDEKTADILNDATAIVAIVGAAARREEEEERI